MSVVLHPGNYFTVVRQIANHLDSDTNYVRAVIRNAYTDAIVETLDLDDKGGQRFKKDWRIPADPSGQGFYVSIVTSVYSDSGYTTKNQNYGDEENTYLVEDRVFAGRGGGGGGIDARTLRRVVKEELDELVKVLPRVPAIPKPIDHSDKISEVSAKVEELKKLVAKVPTERTDLTSVVSGLGEVYRAIQQKEVTPEANLSPVLERVSGLETLVEESQRLTLRSLESLEEKIDGTMINDVVAQVSDIIKNTEFSIAPSTARAELSDTKKGAPEEEFDPELLAS